MRSITLYVAAGGTPLSSGGTSFPGHMSFTLNPGNGLAVESYGYAPIQNKQTLLPAPGEVKENDNFNYLTHDYSRTIEVTQAQYDSLKAFGKDPGAYGFDTSSYWAPSNSCVDFVWKGLQVAGLNRSGYEGSLWPTSNVEDLRKFVELSPTEIKRIDKFLEDLFPLTWKAGIPTNVNDLFEELRKSVQRRDPLVLDLDGDGLELVGASAQVLFDHDANGIKTGTGWAKPDDALLVRDLNGNGLIDNGRELFGVDTLKRNVIPGGPTSGQSI